MMNEPRVFIKDIDEIKEFIKLELDKEHYFDKLWKKASKI